MIPILRMITLAACLTTLGASLIASAAADEARPAMHWDWSGAGHFPQRYELTLLPLPDGRSMAWLDDVGPLRSVDGWGELQRSHRMIAGSVRRIDDRNFILFSELQRAAEFTIAADGVLQMAWFRLTTDAPRDADLLAGRQTHRTYDLPEAMKPAWSPSPKGDSAPGI
jgi:hypothetical protein